MTRTRTPDGPDLFTTPEPEPATDLGPGPDGARVGCVPCPSSPAPFRGEDDPAPHTETGKSTVASTERVPTEGHASSTAPEGPSSDTEHTRPAPLHHGVSFAPYGTTTGPGVCTHCATVTAALTIWPRTVHTGCPCLCHELERRGHYDKGRADHQTLLDGLAARLERTHR